MIEQAPLVLELPEFALFILANVIISYFCLPKLIQEVRGGLFRK